MFNRLGILTARELKISARNHFFTIMVLLAFIYLASILFAIPHEVKFDPKIYFVDSSSNGEIQQILKDFSGFKQRLDSEEQVYAKLQEESYAWGIIAEQNDSVPRVDLIFQGWEDPRMKKMMVAATQDQLTRSYLGTANQFEIREIGKGDFVWPPFNKYLVPLFVFSEVFMVGMFFIAALLFIEREEGTLKAYLVTPAGIWEYVLAKVLAMCVIALTFTALLVVPVLGAEPNYFQLALLIILASAFTSLMGALIASYLNNLSQFIFPGIIVLGILTIPMVSYLFPSFSPPFIKVLPTYDLVFGLRQAVFGLGESNVVYRAAVIFLGLDFVLLYWAKLRFSRQELWG